MPCGCSSSPRLARASAGWSSRRTRRSTPRTMRRASRALTLAILNAELDLVEPWAAAGSYLSTADSNDPHVKAVVLQYEASRLLLVTRASARTHSIFRNMRSAASVSFVVPGVPESHDLIELTAGGVRPLKHKRVTGGTLITLDDFDTTALVLITPDPLMIGVLSRRLATLPSARPSGNASSSRGH